MNYRDFSAIAAHVASEVILNYSSFVRITHPEIENAWDVFVRIAYITLKEYAGVAHWGKAIIDAETAAKADGSLGSDEVVVLDNAITMLINIISNRLDTLDKGMIDGFVSAVHVAGDVTLYNVDWDSDVLEVAQHEEEGVEEYELDPDWVVQFMQTPARKYYPTNQEGLDELGSGSVIALAETSEVFFKDGELFYTSEFLPGVKSDYFVGKAVAVVSHG